LQNLTACGHRRHGGAPFFAGGIRSKAVQHTEVSSGRGLKFLQFFRDRNRMCAQDRLAETIVVDVKKKSQAER